jgi:phosphoglucomutase
LLDWTYLQSSRSLPSPVQAWLTDSRFDAYRSQILAQIEEERWSTLVDSFYRTLPFGTGGRRGTVGIGPNRFNPWTLATSIQGHAAWLRTQLGDQPLSVVIGYDVRRFDDLSRNLVAHATTPVRGITSRHFAEIATEVYAAHDITVYLPPAGSILSTPELSFAVRALKADAGLVISASHNPPDDNGSKFYHGHGGQMVPPFDGEVTDFIKAVETTERMSMDRAQANGLVREIPEEIHGEYIAANLAVSRHPNARSTHIVFTPLHGTADTTVADVLDAAGFPLTIEPSQADHDGSFPNVPFRVPNPERPETLERAIATADEVGASLVMGCDPDADRLGVAVKGEQEWQTLNGNEIAALVCHAALQSHPNSQPLIIKTEVTSSLVSRIAESHGATVVDHLLVGFKYIGEALFMLERKGRFLHIEGDPDCLAAGVEESHGVLVTPEVRDKDAAGGALLLAELASVEQQQNRTLIDTLNDLMNAHGAVYNLLLSTVMKGAQGRARIEAVQQSFRTNPPTSIAGIAVTTFNDHQQIDGVFGPFRSDTDKASRDVLVWHLEGGSRLILRPSGTEPKSKVYVEVSGTPGVALKPEQHRLRNLARHIGHSFIQEMLNRVEVHLPDWALEISDLVSIEDKQKWANELVPDLQLRLQNDPESARQWFATQINTEHRAMLRPGIEAMARIESTDCAALLSCFD